MAERLGDRQRQLLPGEISGLKLSLLTPDRLSELSHGEVTNAHSYDLKGSAVRGGLFCQTIFGPEFSYSCICGKYHNAVKHKGGRCEKCGCDITDSSVRRARFGHITLAVPVVHIWMKSTVSTLLNIPPKVLHEILLCRQFVVVNTGTSKFKHAQTITDKEYFAEREIADFRALTGGAAIEELLSHVNLNDLQKTLRKHKSSRRFSKRLHLVRDLIKGDVKPKHLVIKKLSVMPPALRPFLFMSDGTMASSDINDLYARIINRNKRLALLIANKVPEVLILNDLRLLQLSVDALFQNGKTFTSKDRLGKRVLKSLTDSLKSKTGRLRRNLLGKRVDYSARSVIAAGPHLKLHQCGLPKDLAMDILRPFVYGRLIRMGLASSLKHARRLVDLKRPEAMDALDSEIDGKVVLLNRAPSLHRMSFQAFDPVLIEGKALRLHPFVCSAFNADFDGDQMGVHLPISMEAQIESRLLAGSIYNLFSPATGKPVPLPSQEIVLGIYYLTKEKTGCLGEGKIFGDRIEVVTAYQHEAVELHARVKVRMDGQLIDTTVGRVLFSLVFPDEFPFKAVNQVIKKKDIGKLVEKCFEMYGHRRTIELLDKLKETGFEYATLSGISLCISDATIPKDKWFLIEGARKEVQKVKESFDNGLIGEVERHNHIVDIWKKATEQLTAKMMENLGYEDGDEALTPEQRKDKREFNAIYMMADSGARGSKDQIMQLAAMRGLMAKTTGELVEMPIVSNLREGQKYFEFLLASHGARKGRADGALKTASAGYFTRKLVDCAHAVIINELDCGDDRGIEIAALIKDDAVIIPLSDRIVDRIAAADCIDPKTGDALVGKGQIIDKATASSIEKTGVAQVRVRSPLSCRAAKGLCVACYGRDLASKKMAEIGDAVGIIAAQSIGEPGTQLTLRTFHSGGTASGSAQKSDIRAIEDGRVVYSGIKFVESSNGRRVAVNRSGRVCLDHKGIVKDLGRVPYGAVLELADGSTVEAGTPLVRWDPHAVPVVTAVGGQVEFSGIVEGVSLKTEVDETGLVQRTVVPSGGHLIPRVVVGGTTIQIPIGAKLVVSEGDTVEAGDLLAKTPAAAAKNVDITQGLPKVLQLLEVRRVESPAVLAEIAGEASVKVHGRFSEVVIDSGVGIIKRYTVKAERQLSVYDGDHVSAGDMIVEGVIHPNDVLHVFGPIKAAQFIVDEVQKVYQSQGVSTADKHFEIITKKMIEKIVITDSGDTEFVEGEVTTLKKFESVNRAVDGERAKARFILIGLAKVGKMAESWLSAASFESTVKALTDAALVGKTDWLEGTKENIIIGRVVPVGTGHPSNRNVVLTDRRRGRGRPPKSRFPV